MNDNEYRIPLWIMRGPMNNNPTSEYSDLIDTLRELFPDATIKGSVMHESSNGFRLVPNKTHPRMIVPADSRRAAADAVRRPSASDSTVRRFIRAGMARLLQSHAGPILMPNGVQIFGESDSITRYLSDVLGEPTRISMMIGSRRANRKPVLNVHTFDGAEIGFAKVGLSQLTKELVFHEGNVLSRLGDAKGAPFQTPIRLHSGQWQEHEVLVMTALRPDRPPSPAGSALWRAVAAIASGDGIRESQVSASQWLARLYDSARSLEGTEGQSLLLLLEHFTAVYGEYVLPFGAWHGDFGPWNLNFNGGKPMIWDWERYQTDVPLGIDAVHYTAHRALRRINDLPRARQVLHGGAYEALGMTLNLTGWTSAAARINAIISAYLLMITVRFTVDGATTRGNGSLHTLASWYQYVLTDRLTEVDPNTVGGSFS